MGLSTSPVIYKSGDNIVCIQAWIPMTFNRVNFIFIWYYEFCLILFTLLLSLKCLSNFTGTGPSLVIAATCLSSMKTSLWLQKVYLQQLGDICIWLGIMAGNNTERAVHLVLMSISYSLPSRNCFNLITQQTTCAAQICSVWVVWWTLVNRSVGKILAMENKGGFHSCAGIFFLYQLQF